MAGIRAAPSESTGPASVRLLYGRLVTIVALVAVVSLAHYLTPVHRHDLHALYRWSFHVPVLLAAFWFGLRGGAGVALGVTVLYAPHLIVDWHGGSLVQWLEVALYNVIGWVTGWLAGGLRAESARSRETAERLDHALGELRDRTRTIFETEELLRRAGKLSALGELGATLAHEVRTPLASIRGAAEILSDAVPVDDERYEFTVILQRETDRLNRVVTEFLAFARSPENRTAVADLTDAANEVLRLVRPLAEKQGVSVAGPRESVRARIDPEHLGQVLLNLVVNALQAMPDGGALRISAGASDDGTVRCVVEDDGPGIPETERERVFEPFMTTKPEGTGLGLPLVRRILRSYGGSIEVGGAESGGARFVLRLPTGDVGHGD